MSDLMPESVRPTSRNTRPVVLITDHGFSDVDEEKRVCAEAGCDLIVAQCKDEVALTGAAQNADALLVQWAPVTSRVVAALPARCRVIVRYGIGVDNVDVAAAKARGLPVCNIPDYGVEEVAEHAVALALALARQLSETDRRFRAGTWNLTPPGCVLPWSQMTFATAGLGRIARTALSKVRSLGFNIAAYDPLVSDETFAGLSVRRLGLEDLFHLADILSLHLPLLPSTRHFVNAVRLAQMKPHAVLVNTARGGLIDTRALALALHNHQIGGAGLDVFEIEPPPLDDPIFRAPRTILTSHTAWHSQASGPRLQRMAAEEAVRAIKGEPLRSQINA